MLTKIQKKKKQKKFNYYSYLAKLQKSVGNSLEYEKNLAKMVALKDAFYTFGYTIKCEKQDGKCGIKYPYYEFVKE